MNVALREPRSNLPTQLASFIGREEELHLLGRYLQQNRLLTLTGPGGCGKTRLGLQLARGSLEKFADGVCFVPLAPVRSSELVASTVAQTLGLQDSSGQPLTELLVNHLRGRELLLLLDNFEHLLAAASLVAQLLESTEGVRILVSSRAPLRIRGEQEFPVPPLKLPEESASRGSIAGCESVRLFVERAKAAVPSFELTEQNAAAIAGIARRLDGLPLAIELAAARVRTLPPEALLLRLEHSLALLTSGARDLPDRQHTLRSTIAWSHDLLSQDARRLLAACSVFRGGIELEQIEAVSVAALPIGAPVLDGLEELVEQSLLRSLPGDTPRFLMLETIREFAAERLAELPEAPAVRNTHAAAFLALAEAAQPALTGPEEKEWLERLEREHNNLRAALIRLRDKVPARALRLAGLLAGFWVTRGHFTEGRQQLASLLGAVPDRTQDRVMALYSAGTLAIDQGDFPDALMRLEEAISLARELDDRRGEAWSMLYLGRAAVAGGSAGQGRKPVDDGLVIARELNDQPAIAFGLLYAGLVAMFTGHPEKAEELFTESVETCDRLGYQSLGGRLRQIRAHARIDLGDLGGARRSVEEGLRISLEFKDRWVVQIGLTAFAGIAVKSARPARALRLAGAALGYAERGEFRMPPVLQERIEGWLAPARKALAATADRALDEGKAMSLEEAVGYALSDAPDDPPRQGRGPALSRRELEVARLAATGLTNREIAAKLFLSVRTVEVHVDHVLTKLGFNNRTQLAAWAYEEKLLPEIT
jgi:predicted ATPase/DNA-binding CsgD family transcriptional regulator